MKGSNRSRLFRVLPLLAVAVAASLLFSGCLWGVVRDAETGNPLPGVTVNYTDANGASGSAVTDANGIFVVDQKYGPVPAVGPISFQISEPGFEPLTAARMMQYNDNANASLADLSSFWEVQGFQLVREKVQRVQVEIPVVDVDSVSLPPAVPGGATILAWVYVVRANVYSDPADPSAGGCQDELGQATAPGDPSPLAFGSTCTVLGDDFRLVVTATLIVYTQQGFPPVVIPYAVVSTAAYDWIAPSPNTSWQTVTINSNDATGPDSANIRFEAQLRFRAVYDSSVPPVASDVNLKEGFAPVDRREILRRLVALPITSWSYISEPGVRHVGPMAQDFYAAFGLGGSDRRIEVVDAYGVAFAAIQELNDMLVEKDRQIAALQRQVADLTTRVAALEAKLGR
ncbi:MAG: carboxypeptidase regulatory-like domain-containing protein [Dehalococcoidia bacterium]|nr:carboxypeptidase regulatory-like domain-containing protein [Dehalococcoidia bacterium]